MPSCEFRPIGQVSMIKNFLLVVIIFFLFFTSLRINSEAREEHLKTLAEKKDKYIGTAVSFQALENDKIYSEVLVDEFSVVTPENELKFNATEPRRNLFDFKKADAIVEFARSRNMKIRGHTLVWYRSDPQWTKEKKYSKEELKEILHNHIKSVVGHYKGKIYCWDVVNEAFESDGSLRHNIWYNIIGPEYIEMAFRWAHEADQNALLFYNDFDIEVSNVKSDAVYKFIKELENKGVPINGIGFQAHFDLDSDDNIKRMDLNIKRFAELGLETNFTELDITIAENILKQKFFDIGPHGTIILSKLINAGLLGEVSSTKVRMRNRIDLIENGMRKISGKDFDKIWYILQQSLAYGPMVNRKEKLKKQAEIYSNVFRACLDYPSCKGVVLWGFTDAYAWLRHAIDSDAPNIFDKQYNPKQAYYEIMKVISR